jgi:mRNA interferase MazF
VLSPTIYNRQVGLVVVCPITSAQRDYPWEVEIPMGEHVCGVILADQLKNMAWRERHAEFICTPSAQLLIDVIEKAFVLLNPDEYEA